jgi:geranylgeranyl diphosphate synthase, type II
VKVINQINIIPKQGEIRDMLRREARILVSAKKIRPPVNFETIAGQARDLLKSLNLDDRYLEFAIVLTANEIWSEVVSSTPFNRRLLLLPQCLRDINNCSGVFDNMGLICAGCNNCRINQILEESEGLGYITLVADGTTVAINLVEEGAIDAVIGVGCMPVLKQSFRPVNHVAVPAIALPLLFDGCNSTTLDYSWLSEEIRKFTFNPGISPLSVSTIRNQVREYFTSVVLERYFDKNEDTERLALEVMKTGGQRMRPLLLLLACKCYGGDDTNFPVLAVLIECFHKASLIHDDIEDGSDTRYGMPAFHRTEGVPVAINIGDYLIGKGYSLLSGLQCKPEVLSECFRLVSESHLKMAKGQGADIKLPEKIKDYSSMDLLRIYRLKTGEAVKISLLLGAVLGNASATELQRLENFSESFGAAYQIRDDLMEYRENKDTFHPLNFPFLMVLLAEAAGKGISMNGLLTGSDNILLRNSMEQYQIEEKAEGFLRDSIKSCYIELDRLENDKLRLSLYGVTGKVFKDFDV